MLTGDLAIMFNDTRIPTDLSLREQTRQEAQHAYIKKALGFSIHPDIDTSLSAVNKSEARALEISVIPQLKTGDLADPPIHLSDHIHPHELAKDNALNKPSLLKIGQFDFITLSLLHTILRSDQWDSITTRLVQLLKPGGWIQWVDWDPSTLRIAGVRPGTPDATALRALLRRYTDTLSERQIGSTYRIETTFKQQGVVDIDSDMYPIAPEVEFTKNVVEGVVMELEEWGVLGREGAKKVRAEVGEEVEKGGVLIWWDLWCHIGRKPS
ncbi:hypothetical protein TI39_contig4211g00014 [Zymoseptoria brevis]|uniref:Methyltransferase domain-containing protein n=1 Tax=Zymoseptoria brevis TaxID=1047168 RepID=A0A0F4G9V7_9PEZI|nr:hypothetical protein TI39_contig4211g00014 [Zymoseptoria brevis]